MEDNDEFDFTTAIENPFKGMMKKGYSVTVHYDPYDEMKFDTQEEIIDRELDTLKVNLLDKTKNISNSQILNIFEKFYAIINQMK